MIADYVRNISLFFVCEVSVTCTSIELRIVSFTTLQPRYDHKTNRFKINSHRLLFQPKTVDREFFPIHITML